VGEVSNLDTLESKIGHNSVAQCGDCRHVLARVVKFCPYCGYTQAQPVKTTALGTTLAKVSGLESEDNIIHAVFRRADGGSDGCALSGTPIPETKTDGAVIAAGAPTSFASTPQMETVSSAAPTSSGPPTPDPSAPLPVKQPPPPVKGRQKPGRTIAFFLVAVPALIIFIASLGRNASVTGSVPSPPTGAPLTYTVVKESNVRTSPTASFDDRVRSNTGDIMTVARGATVVGVVEPSPNDPNSKWLKITAGQFQNDYVWLGSLTAQ